MATGDPILVQFISSHPFEYSEKGLMFKGHARESIRDLTRWLNPNSKTPKPMIKKMKKMKKDWWLAQLRLYGIKASASTKIADLKELLKGSLAKGLKGPTKDILELERKLGPEFLQKNVDAREKEYKSIGDEGRAENYSERFLKEKFFDGKKKEKLMALQMSCRRDSKLRQAASDLGLHFATATGAYNWPWIVLGKDKAAVLEKKCVIEKERREWAVKVGVTIEEDWPVGATIDEDWPVGATIDEDWHVGATIEEDWPVTLSTELPGEEKSADNMKRRREEHQGNAKRQKVEVVRHKSDTGGKGSFKDVEGEWSIDCPKMDHNYSDVTQPKRMSLFFHKPQPPQKKTVDSDDEEESFSETDEECYSDAEEVGKLKPSPEICLGSVLLTATFEMGIFEGTLRSSAGNFPPQSASFPVLKLSFSWRGRNTSEGEIQFDSEGDQRGNLSFTSKTEMKGILKSSYGNFPFTGCKVGKVPVDKRVKWEQYSERAHRREEISRWR